MLATDRCEAGGNRQRRVGGAHLGGVRDSVNGFLQKSYKELPFSINVSDLALLAAGAILVISFPPPGA